MISEAVQEAFNKQINAETYSAYLYWSMAAYFEDIGLKGHASWMRCQAQEEMLHAAKFFDYIVERDGRVQLTAIEGPPVEWDSALAVFEAAYAHEQKVTGLINDLVRLAGQESDPASTVFLEWFVTEQVEEEASAKEIADQLKLIGDNGYGLLMIDRVLGQRVFTPPPAKSEGA